VPYINGQRWWEQPESLGDGGGDLQSCGSQALMHVKCIHDFCTLPLDIPPFLHHILVIFMFFDDY
jgi:hypothetical protein